jgi:hypothetical protein
MAPSYSVAETHADPGMAFLIQKTRGYGSGSPTSALVTSLIEITTTLRQVPEQGVDLLFVLQVLALVPAGSSAGFAAGSPAGFAAVAAIAVNAMAILTAVFVVMFAMSVYLAIQKFKTAYSTIKPSNLKVTHKGQDLILLAGVLAKQLVDTFDRIDKYSIMSQASKSRLKDRWLQRYRDILFTQLLLPTNQTSIVDGEVDILVEAHSKLDDPSVDYNNIPDLIKRLQSVRAEHLAAAPKHQPNL